MEKVSKLVITKFEFFNEYCQHFFCSLGARILYSLIVIYSEIYPSLSVLLLISHIRRKKSYQYSCLLVLFYDFHLDSNRGIAFKYQ